MGMLTQYAGEVGKFLCKLFSWCACRDLHNEALINKCSLSDWVAVLWICCVTFTVCVGIGFYKPTDKLEMYLIASAIHISPVVNKYFLLLQHMQSVSLHLLGDTSCSSTLAFY